ncbi:MAG: hypothetical protein Kow0074_23080 [Candidatus Zixiibacteriota bacterium]
MNWLTRIIRTGAIACLSLTLLAMIGCRNGETSQTRFSDTFASPETMAEHLLIKLKEMDKAGLHEMLITQYEHDSIVAPAMGRTNDIEFGWYMLRQNCLKGVKRNLELYGGRDFKLEYVKFDQGEEHYPPLILHRGTILGVTDRVTGESGELDFCGTVIEENGRFKLVSIRD